MITPTAGDTADNHETLEEKGGCSHRERLETTRASRKRTQGDIVINDDEDDNHNDTSQSANVKKQIAGGDIVINDDDENHNETSQSANVKKQIAGLFQDAVNDVIDSNNPDIDDLKKQSNGELRKSMKALRSDFEPSSSKVFNIEKQNKFVRLLAWPWMRDHWKYTALLLAMICFVLSVLCFYVGMDGDPFHGKNIYPAVTQLGWFSFFFVGLNVTIAFMFTKMERIADDMIENMDPDANCRDMMISTFTNMSLVSALLFTGE